MISFGAKRILLVAAFAVFAGTSCSTGDPDTLPADGGRIGRATAKADSSLNQARDRIRTIDSLGASME